MNAAASANQSQINGQRYAVCVQAPPGSNMIRVCFFLSIGSYFPSSTKVQLNLFYSGLPAVMRGRSALVASLARQDRSLGLIAQPTILKYQVLKMDDTVGVVFHL